MKKEGFALLLLFVIVSGSVMNLHYLRSLSGELTQCVAFVSAEAARGNWEEAETQASAALEHWSGSDKYTHIFIRHREIDAITEDFCGLLGAIRSRDPGELYAARLSLMLRLENLYEMERFKTGSIL